MKKEYTCKDCVLHDTEACRYGFWNDAYSFGEKNCEDIIVETKEEAGWIDTT